MRVQVYGGLCNRLRGEADQDGNEWIGRDPGDYPQLFEQVRRGGPFPVGTGSRFRNVPMPEKDT